MSIIDLSLLIDNDCQTCGTSWHEKVNIERKGTLETVGRNTSKIVLGSHSATHMDAPLHFMENGHDIASTSLEKCVGEVTCVDLRHIGAGEKVGLDVIRKFDVSSRMLFVFSWYKKWKTDSFYSSFPCFTEEAIHYLIDGGIELMAMDTPSPDDGSAITQKDDSPNHKRLLANDVVIVEYLSNTDEIDFTKKYEIIALPLKIADADGSPARVILREVL